MLIYLSMIEDAEDQNKFEQVYLRYKNLMFYVAHRILNDAQEAEDAVHDAFVRIAEHIDQVGEPDCPKTRGFVVIIVERVALNRLERRRRREALPLEKWTPTARQEDPAPEEEEAFRRAMARLSPRYRELLLLKHWQGFSDREIGKMLSMSQGNVARTLQRAKEKLREALKEEGVEVCSGMSSGRLSSSQLSPAAALPGRAGGTDLCQAGSHFCAGLCGPVLLGTHDSGCRLPTAGITGGGAGVL